MPPLPLMYRPLCAALGVLLFYTSGLPFVLMAALWQVAGPAPAGGDGWRDIALATCEHMFNIGGPARDAYLDSQVTI
eukprot:gene2838-1604_t